MSALFVIMLVEVGVDDGVDVRFLFGIGSLSTGISFECLFPRVLPFTIPSMLLHTEPVDFLKIQLMISPSSLAVLPETVLQRILANLLTQETLHSRYREKILDKLNE